MTADSRSHVANGSPVRSIAPTAPRTEMTQNPSAKASTTASEMTVNHGTADDGSGEGAAGRADAAPVDVDGTGVGRVPAPPECARKGWMG
ncbi:hypothetical protein GCM10027039_18940 [Terrabacter koreensis]